MDTGTKNTFGKAEHLKSRKQINALFAGGRSFFVHPLKVYFQVVRDHDDGRQATGGSQIPNPFLTQVGVSASKRNFKKAVDRNQVKRLLREAYRLHKKELHDLARDRRITLQVFFIYVDKTLPTFAAVEAKMKTCLTQLKKIVEESS